MSVTRCLACNSEEGHHIWCPAVRIGWTSSSPQSTAPSLDPDPLTVWPEERISYADHRSRCECPSCWRGRLTGLLLAALSGALVGFVLGVAVGWWWT